MSTGTLSEEPKPKPRARPRFYNPADLQKWGQYKAVIVALGKCVRGGRAFDLGRIQREMDVHISDIRMLYGKTNAWTMAELSVPLHDLPADYDLSAMADTVA